MSSVNIDWYLNKLGRRYQEFEIQDHSKHHGKPRTGTIDEIRGHFRDRRGVINDDIDLMTSLNLLNRNGVADISKPSDLTLPRFQAPHDLCALNSERPGNYDDNERNQLIKDLRSCLHGAIAWIV